MNDDKPRQTHPAPPATAPATQALTFAPSLTDTSPPAPSPSPTPTIVPVHREPGGVILPILLYHHIDPLHLPTDTSTPDGTQVPSH